MTHEASGYGLWTLVVPPDSCRHGARSLAPT